MILSSQPELPWEWKVLVCADTTHQQIEFADFFSFLFTS